MNRLYALFFGMLLLAGCATMGDVLDILVPEDEPVCDKDAAGVWYNGQVCAKFSDGTFRWTKP